MNRPLKFTACAVAALLASACGTLPSPTAAPPVLQAAVPGPLRECATLAASFRFDQTHLDSAVPVAAGALKQGARPVPGHCLVKGRMHERKGSDGQTYAIAFEMRLPDAWNGRFYYQGNGGLDGSVREALGALGGGPLGGALMQGFAVISSDAGHTGRQTTVFGLEPEARLDYGYKAVGKLTPMAKSLIQAAYGKGPDRSYIGGCSNGGRHAMVAAARYGDQYDGYLVGAPGYRLPNAAVAQLWGAQQWHAVATAGATVRHPMNPNATLPDLGSGFTPDERHLMAKAIADKCDALDGLRDGMVQATQACQARFSVAADVPTCTGNRNGSCLSAAQKQVIARVFAGGATSSGQPLYAAFAYDTGVAGDNWATWKFINSLALDPLSTGTVFSVPPGPVDPLTDDVSARLQRFSATNNTYTESGLALMTPPGQENPVNLAGLRARGGKMVIFHGVSDPIFSAEDTRQWMERLDKAQGGQAAGFARYFPVPGMNHCSGGPAADQFDLLTPLVEWVEHGVAPQAVTAAVRGAGNAGGANAELPREWPATRTRPLCAYPTVATYQGHGNPEDAASFACR
ncbi:MAG: tannase/feruloyl esterase family alpha/beta hydrolase [Ramlibacter sp.]|nr:tannase/feruloyl esterase family alpha/beta hydrolase [Ramlibacter sp.]